MATYVKYMNKTLKILHNYIKNLSKYEKKYYLSKKGLYNRSKYAVKESYNIQEHELKIVEIYRTATGFYNELCGIVKRFKNGVDVEQELRKFNDKLNLARLPKFETILTLKTVSNPIDKSAFCGAITGGAAMLTESIQADLIELTRPDLNNRKNTTDIQKLIGQVTINEYAYSYVKFNLELNAEEILSDLKVIKKKIHNDLDNLKYSEIIDKKEKLLNDIDSLSVKIYNYIDALPELNSSGAEEMFQNKSFELIQLNARRKELYDHAEYLRLKALQLKWNERVANNKAWGEDAAAIWKLASSKFTEGLEYIEKNGYLLSSVSELNNEELETAIRKKLEKQIKKSEAKVLVLNENSSLANHLSKDLEFIIFIRNNTDKLKKQKYIPNTSLNFDVRIQSTTNSHLALHKCDVKNIFLDENNFIHALIVDTVDYNFGEKEVEELRELQENGFLKNYIIIVNIVKPLEFYSNYTNLNKIPYFYGRMK